MRHRLGRELREGEDVWVVVVVVGAGFVFRLLVIPRLPLLVVVVSVLAGVTLPRPVFVLLVRVFILVVMMVIRMARIVLGEELHDRVQEVYLHVLAVAWSYAQRRIVTESDSVLVWYDYDKLAKCNPGDDARRVLEGRMALGRDLYEGAQKK